MRLCIGVAFWLLHPGVSAEELTRFASVRGPVQLVEEGGRAALLINNDVRLPLPPDWRQTDIAMAAQLTGQQTAFVVSYADRTCEARQALMVITPTRVWGPYVLGGCEESMAFQVSARNDALVAIRADGATPRAWVYTVDDNAFRGPAGVVLPSRLSRLADAAPAPDAPPATVAAPPRAPAPPAPVVQTVPVAKAPVLRAVTPLPAAVPARTKSTPLSTEDAGAISRQLKATTKPQTRVTLDLS